MLAIRTWHTYLGILIAPSVLFFALTGALQIFSLHEAHGNYKPLQVIEKLSSLHKDQVFDREEHEKAPEATDEDQHEPPSPRLGTVLLKWFFLLVAMALTTSTLLGLWIGLTNIRRKRVGLWLLATGIVVPTIFSVLAS